MIIIAAVVVIIIFEFRTYCNLLLFPVISLVQIARYANEILFMQINWILKQVYIYTNTHMCTSTLACLPVYAELLIAFDIYAIKTSFLFKV
jgi:hypothetical protein